MTNSVAISNNANHVSCVQWFYAGEMPNFELAQEEREYQGGPEDRKALMAHRKHVQDRERELAKQQAAWLAARQGPSTKAAPKSPSSAAIKVCLHACMCACVHVRMCLLMHECLKLETSWHF